MLAELLLLNFEDFVEVVEGLAVLPLTLIH